MEERDENGNSVTERSIRMVMFTLASNLEMLWVDAVWIFAIHLSAYWGSVVWTGYVYENQFRSFDKCVRKVLYNQLVWTPLTIGPLLLLACPTFVDMPVWMGVVQLPLCVCVTDIIFYHLHRMMHWPSLYPYHKEHHAWRTPIGASALYADAFEHIVVNVLPPLLAGVLLRCHPWVMCLWVGVASANTVVAHAKPGQHADHHEKFKGNYGVGLMLCDRLYGTYI